MGVLGLWELLESVGHPVKIEGLEGKVLGVDANIWLYKFIRGFREKDNATNIESHKLGLFNRICKLLFYRIKPVFVFDGPAPVLKRRTLERRQNIRNKQLMKHQDAAMKILANQLKSQYPNAKIDDLKITMPNLISNNLVAAEKLTDEDRDLFYLPETAKLDADDSESDESDDSDYIGNDFHSVGAKVDIHSKDFGQLPPEMRYEILQDVKLSTKRIRNSGNLPEDANSFSNFQLERLKARRKVQQKIEECEKEICTNYTGELADGTSIQAFRVQSDAQATILYRPSTYNPEPVVKPEAKPFPRETDQISTEPKPPSPESEIDLSKISPPHQMLDNSTEGGRNIDKNPDLVHLSETIELEDDDSSSSDSEVEFIPIETLSDSTDVEIHSDESKDPPVELSEAEEEAPSITIDDDDNQSEINFEHGSANSIKQMCSASSGFVSSQLNDISEDSPDNTDKDSSLSDKPSIRTEPVSSHGSPKSTQAHEEPPPELSRGILSRPEAQIESKVPETDGDEPVVMSQPDPVSIPTTISDVHSDKADVIANHTASSSQPTTERPQASKSAISSHDSSSRVGPQDPGILSEPSNEPKAAAKRVTNKIVEDAKELLRLFGIPYIDAAGEAEAQCAKLEELKLTEGTITDDSDIWLFGAQNVFRYFFNEDKYVMQYKMTDIEFHIRMTRENLVCFAMMVGSDYTDGVMNIGHVTAVEILSEFPGDGLSPLIQFRDWHREALKDLKAAKKDVKRRKLLKYQLPDEFPSRLVYEGYLKPVADTSTESFSWGMPELDELREYARRNFGWDPKKVDEKLVPVMKRLNEKKIQKTIDTFFFKTQANRNPEMFRSKRVNQALNKIAKRAARDGGAKPALDETIVLSEEDDED